MGLFKVLGCVAAGIGAVACLPVMGAVGAVTLTGALVGGTVGAIGGAIASSAEEEEKAKCKRDGVEEGIAKCIIKLKEMKSRSEDSEAYFKFLIALVAVGMATANADGEICAQELQEIEEFTAGVGCSELPAHVKEAITKLKNTPPSFNTAMNYVWEAGNVDLSLFEAVIEVVSASDGRFDEKEKALLVAFREAVEAHPRA